ncbi:MAG: hypothetical protein HRT44_04350 [Bdellovibrionales bacterium]|nr:hypothetical protein [Bdellovibrionales bacterium]NQZ18475.1 hypothetical protein [Bdellovibrionales bacterium]
MLLSFLTLLSFFAFAEDKVLVEFENRIETCIAQEILWEQMELSMEKSTDTWLWPNPLSEVEGAGMIDDSQIDVTYKSFFFSRTYSYLLSEVEAGVGFRYTAIEGQHPFEGGAQVWFETIDNKTIFYWKGEYLTDPGDWMERAFFESYSKDFFESFAETIEDREKDLCQVIQ